MPPNITLRTLTTAVGFALSGLLTAQAQAPQAAKRSEVVPDRYIVVFKDSVGNSDEAADHLAHDAGGRVHQRFRHLIKGFSATIPAHALRRLRNNPNVAYVENDVTMHADQALTSQSNPTWGLDRINQRDRPLDAIYTYSTKASGVTAYVIDTGILASHQEFTGRMAAGYSVIADGYGTSDCNGHGTHVAGTLGGTVYGVAKGVTLVPVRVLDCAGSGTSSGVLAGIDWMVGVAKPGSVANLSLGGGISATLDAAVANAVAKGITVVVAAGNSAANACDQSPARAPSAITVGASTSTDTQASYSNFGACVDLYAPGSSITSAWHTGNTALAILNGTSMASPHVAGIAALVVAANPGFTPAQVTEAVLKNASNNKLTGLGTGSPNLLSYALVANAAPVVSYTVAVKSITGTATRVSLGWTAKATVTVRDLASGSVLPNATVSGRFGNGSTASCATGLAGACTLTSTRISNLTSLTTFSVTGISGQNMTYYPTQNAATQITIRRP